MDMSQDICHDVYVNIKQHVCSCQSQKETLPRTGDGSVERARCMTLILSKIICHTLYMSQSICHNCLGLGVMKSYEHVANETSQEA